MRFRDFHSNVKIRIFVMFAFGLAQATTFPFMAVYFARNFGETMTGALLAFGIVASMVSGAIGGYYADRIGRRKLMILSESVFLISYTTMALANSPWLNSPVITFLAFVTNNVCWGIYGPTDEAMLLDVTQAEHRQFMYSIFYWLHNLTMAVGASIGAALFESYRFELFACMSFVVLCTLLTTIFFIQETYHPSLIQRDATNLLPKGIIRNYLSVLKDCTFVVYIVAGMLVMTQEFQLSNYIGIRLAKQIKKGTFDVLHAFTVHFDGMRMLGFLQTENTILVVLLAGIAVKIIQRIHDRWVLFFGLTLFAVGYSVITVSSTPLVLLIAMFAATLGEVSSIPVRQSYLGDIAATHARSSYVAVNGMTFSGAQMLASFGVMLGVYVPSWGMGLISLTCGLTGLLLYQAIVPSVHKRRSAVTSSVSV